MTRFRWIAVVAVVLTLGIAAVAAAASAVSMSDARYQAKKAARHTANRIGASTYELGSCSRASAATVFCGFYTYNDDEGQDCNWIVRVTGIDATTDNVRTTLRRCY